jgi:glycosyltransferase involved in cell wall biosynthesis
LVKQGHEVYALVGSLEGSPAFQEVQGVKIHRRDLMNPFYVRERKAQLGIPAAAVAPTILREIKAMYGSFIEENRIDIVHAHNFHHFLPCHALTLTELHDQGLPTVLTIHEVWSELICKDLLERTKWDAIIGVSRHVVREIVTEAPHLKDLHLIYHGIDTDLFSPANGNDGRRDLVCRNGRSLSIRRECFPGKG